MQGRNGVSADTPNRLVLDAGQAFANIDITALGTTGEDPLGAAVAGAINLGATRGGGKFNPNRTLREIPVDGQLGPTKGFIRRGEVRPTMEIMLLEMTLENLKTIYAGSTSEVVGDFTKLTGGPVVEETYFENIALVCTYSGNDNPVVIVVDNPIVFDAAEFATQDEDEVVVSATFVGTFDPANPSVEPWSIYHPGEG